MNISYNWLKNYINTDLKTQEISEILTAIGLEIGGIEEVQSIKGGLEGIVVGEVLTCSKHPDADKLSVTTVNIGQEEPLPIVCGAPNVAAGQKVVVATVGTTLYAGDDSFQIKKAKIRGEKSMGMICAEDEIGLGKGHDGIMVIEAEAVPGTPAKEYFNMESDIVFEVDLTPNRVDAASHIGVARDLAAYLKQSHTETKINIPSVEDFKADNNNYPIEIEIAAPEACNRFAGVTISDITVSESPEWLQNRLKAIGLTPINNVVDVTNYVLHECGQPLHAYDGSQIKGDKVIAKTLPAGSKFVTLDEQERELSDKDLMICNSEEGMCIAGVFGGIHSGVSKNTTKVFLESAYFNPVSVRKTAKRHTLSTDASFRFERGIDPNNTLWALKRAAMLIKEVAGGTISSEITDLYPTPINNHEVEVKWANITRLIGQEIPKKQIKTILEGLEMAFLNENDETFTLSVPAYRVDVQREADVIEDILRIYGYNNVEMTDKVNSTIVYSKTPDNDKVKNNIANQLAALGCNEIMCNSLTKVTYYEELKSYPREKVVELSNPLSSDLNGMRQTLLFGGLESIQYNRNRKNTDIKFFEFGNCYFHKDKSVSGEQKNYGETQQLALFLSGNMATPNWNTPAKEVSFADIKSYTNNILAKAGIPEKNIKTDACENDLFAEGLTYTINNKTIAQLGLVSGKLLKQFDIEVPVFFADINWDVLLKETGKKKVLFTDIPKFPEVKRDLALLLNSEVTFAQIKTIAEKVEKKLLKQISLFDIYQGDKLGAGKKSYAVSFILQDETKTLNDKQIDKIMQKMIKSFEHQLGAQLR